MKRQKVSQSSAEIKEYCHFADDHDHLSVTEWSNGEGFDLVIDKKNSTIFQQFTFGEWECLKEGVNYLLYE